MYAIRIWKSRASTVTEQCDFFGTSIYFDIKFLSCANFCDVRANTCFHVQEMDRMYSEWDVLNLASF